MPTRDAAAMLVFAAMVTSTGTGQPRTVGSGARATISTTYITAAGASRRTGLPVDVAANALGRLERGGLARRGGGGDCWCTDLHTIAAAAGVAGGDQSSGR